VKANGPVLAIDRKEKNILGGPARNSWAEGFAGLEKIELSCQLGLQIWIDSKGTLKFE
jgi:hypothetical protein